MPTNRTQFLGVGFDRLGIDDVLAKLAQVEATTPYGYVVTPNVDHLVRLDREGADRTLSGAYRRAELCLCDSRVLRKLARLRGFDLPAVPGSDLTVRLFDEVIRVGDRIAIIGGDPALLASLKMRYPGIEFVHNFPPMGLRESAEARQKVAAFIAGAHARFAFIAVGSPQQEKIAASVLNHEGAAGFALCIGASLDFIVGKQARAPKVMQQMGLEWLYRLTSEPRRMWRRYLVEGPRIFLIFLRDLRMPRNR